MYLSANLILIFFKQFIFLQYIRPQLFFGQLYLFGEYVCHTQVKGNMSFMQKQKSSYLKQSLRYLLMISLILPLPANSAMSELRFKTLLNICEAAQSNSDLGTVRSIAQQLKAAKFETDSDLGKQAIRCIKAAFPPDKKPVSYEDLTVKINRLETEVSKLCFDLLELKPANAITFEPCKKFY